MQIKDHGGTAQMACIGSTYGPPTERVTVHCILLDASLNGLGRLLPLRLKMLRVFAYLSVGRCKISPSPTSPAGAFSPSASTLQSIAVTSMDFRKRGQPDLGRLALTVCSIGLVTTQGKSWRASPYSEGQVWTMLLGTGWSRPCL